MNYLISTLRHNKKLPLFILFISILNFPSMAQQDRFQVINQRLKDLSVQVPGLNQKTDLSISNGSLQEFLRGLAAANNLNLNISPSLTQKISNNFSDETVINILMFLTRQYNLDLAFIGTIVTVSPYYDSIANQLPPPKELKVSFNTFFVDYKSIINKKYNNNNKEIIEKAQNTEVLSESHYLRDNNITAIF